MRNLPKVTVIIPIYNVEKYVERCARTLFAQTLDELEFIFVDDCSKDLSINIIESILKEYPQRQNQVKILRHKNNKGVASARLTGILASKGEYLIHCDPDDYVDVTIYEKLYNKIKVSEADIVICNSVKVEENGFYENENREYPTSEEYLLNWFTSNCSYYALWDKLMRRSLIMENLIFPQEGVNIGEDFECVVKAFYYAKKIVVEKSKLYYYCMRSDSITNSTLTPETVIIKCGVAQRIGDFFRDTKFETFSYNFKFHTKLILRSYYKDKRNEWFSLFSECHTYVLKYNDNPFLVRLLWFLILQNKKIFELSQKYYNIFEV